MSTKENFNFGRQINRLWIRKTWYDERSKCYYADIWNEFPMHLVELPKMCPKDDDYHELAKLHASRDPTNKNKVSSWLFEGTILNLIRVNRFD